ncbi:cobyric acid synthase CobQ, partial [Nocardia cyriacigeorgica]|nr:cobyric acid synthase CobQ [Nocardia cyriacigeorgica]
LLARAAVGGPILGICGGYQMLGARIVDQVESAAGPIDGLGLLDLEIEFADPKLLRRVIGVGGAGMALRGYEIHHGRVHRTGDPHWLHIGPEVTADPATDVLA